MIELIDTDNPSNKVCCGTCRHWAPLYDPTGKGMRSYNKNDALAVLRALFEFVPPSERPPLEVVGSCEINAGQIESWGSGHDCDFMTGVLATHGCLTWERK